MMLVADNRGETAYPTHEDGAEHTGAANNLPVSQDFTADDPCMSDGRAGAGALLPPGASRRVSTTPTDREGRGKTCERFRRHDKLALEPYRDKVLRNGLAEEESMELVTRIPEEYGGREAAFDESSLASGMSQQPHRTILLSVVSSPEFCSSYVA